MKKVELKPCRCKKCGRTPYAKWYANKRFFEVCCLNIDCDNGAVILENRTKSISMWNALNRRTEASSAGEVR